MKSLSLNSTIQMNYIECGNLQSNNVIILLHGYSQSAQIISKLLLDSLPSDYHIIIPNGLYPFAQVDKTSGKRALKYSWYVFDPVENKYIIDYCHTVNAFINFFKEKNILNKNINIVGYSQGGYLSLFLSEKIKEIKNVIGLGCRYRTDLLIDPPTHSYFTSIHGELDNIVDYQQAKQSFNELKDLNVKGDFITLKDTGHRLNKMFQDELSQLFQRL